MNIRFKSIVAICGLIVVACSNSQTNTADSQAQQPPSIVGTFSKYAPQQCSNLTTGISFDLQSPEIIILGEVHSTTKQTVSHLKSGQYKYAISLDTDKFSNDTANFAVDFDLKSVSETELEISNFRTVVIFDDGDVREFFDRGPDTWLLCP